MEIWYIAIYSNHRASYPAVPVDRRQFMEQLFYLRKSKEMYKLTIMPVCLLTFIRDETKEKLRNCQEILRHFLNSSMNVEK